MIDYYYCSVCQRSYRIHNYDYKHEDFRKRDGRGLITFKDNYGRICNDCIKKGYTQLPGVYK